MRLKIQPSLGTRLLCLGIRRLFGACRFWYLSRRPEPINTWVLRYHCTWLSTVTCLFKAFSHSFCGFLTLNLQALKLYLWELFDVWAKCGFTQIEFAFSPAIHSEASSSCSNFKYLAWGSLWSPHVEWMQATGHTWWNAYGYYILGDIFFPAQCQRWRKVIICTILSACRQPGGDWLENKGAAPYVLRSLGLTPTAHRPPFRCPGISRHSIPSLCPISSALSGACHPAGSPILLPENQQTRSLRFLHQNENLPVTNASRTWPRGNLESILNSTEI